MKRVFAVILSALLMLICLPVSAADASTVFTVTCSSGTKTALATVSASANSGISAASLNIIYDYKKLTFEGYETGDALSCDIVSVDDNGFGQIRFAFCDSKDYFRATGDILLLSFSRKVDEAFDSVISVKSESKAVFDLNYKEISFSAVPATLSFAQLVQSEPSLSSEAYAVDNETMRITEIPLKTAVADFESAFNYPVTANANGQYIQNGCQVSAVIDGEAYTYTAIVMGDLNGNGKLDTADYIIIRRVLLGITAENELYSVSGDMNGNGKLDSADYIVMRRMILGII